MIGLNNVLVVCVGNICRSPVGEILLRNSLSDRFEIRSAGLQALVGKHADPESIRWCNERGLDLGHHIAQQLTNEQTGWADLILVMEKHHRSEVGRRYPEYLGKNQLLGQWIGQDIPDPYHKTPEFFDHALSLVEQGVSSWVRRLES